MADPEAMTETGETSTPLEQRNKEVSWCYVCIELYKRISIEV